MPAAARARHQTLEAASAATRAAVARTPAPPPVEAPHSAAAAVNKAQATNGTTWTTIWALRTTGTITATICAARGSRVSSAPTQRTSQPHKSMSSPEIGCPQARCVQWRRCRGAATCPPARCGTVASCQRGLRRRALRPQRDLRPAHRLPLAPPRLGAAARAGVVEVAVVGELDGPLEFWRRSDFVLREIRLKAQFVTDMAQWILLVGKRSPLTYVRYLQYCNFATRLFLQNFASKVLVVVFNWGGGGRTCFNFFIGNLILSAGCARVRPSTALWPSVRSCWSAEEGLQPLSVQSGSCFRALHFFQPCSSSSRISDTLHCTSS